MITVPAVVRGQEIQINKDMVKSWTVFAANVIDGELQSGDTFRCWIDQSKWTRFMQGALEQ